MLLLPPALRGFLANFIFPSHGYGSTPQSLAHAFNLWRRRRKDVLSRYDSRRYATASTFRHKRLRNNDSEIPPATSKESEISKSTERQKSAASILEDLEADRCHIGDDTYDEVERQLLVKFLSKSAERRSTYRRRRRLRERTRQALKSEDLTLLRSLAIRQPDVPQLLHAKASSRLENTAAEIPTNEWLNRLSEATGLLQSGKHGKSQKAEAKELLDILWIAKLSQPQGELADKLETSVREALNSSVPLGALKSVALKHVHELPRLFELYALPTRLRERTLSLLAQAACGRPVSTTSTNEDANTQSELLSSDNDNVPPQFRPDVASTPVNADKESKDVNDKSDGVSAVPWSSLTEFPTGSTRIPAESSERTTPPISITDVEVSEETSQSKTRCPGSAKEREDAIEMEMLDEFLRQVGYQKGKAEKARLETELDDALRRQDALVVLRSLAVREKRQNAPHLAPRLYNIAVKAKLKRALTDLQDTLVWPTVWPKTHHRDEAKELIRSLSRPVDFAGLQRGGMQNPEAFVEAIDSVSGSDEPIIALRLVALVCPSVPQRLRLSTSKKLRAAHKNDASCLQTRDCLSRLFKREPSAAERFFDSFELPTVNRILDHYPMPAREQLPLAPAVLWDPRQARTALDHRCQSRRLAMKVQQHVVKENISKNQRLATGPEHYFDCVIHLKIAEMCEETCHGNGLTGADAKDAAWLHLLSKMQVSGALAELFAPSDSTNNTQLTIKSGDSTLQAQAGSTQASSDFATPGVHEELHLFDLEHIQSEFALPSREHYPNTLQELWDPTLASVAITNGCMKRKISLESEVSYAEHRIPTEQLKAQLLGREIYLSCTLKVSIENICHETGCGEGPSKNDARRAAWLHVLSKLHVSGALREIFPDSRPNNTDADEVAAESSKTGESLGLTAEEHFKLEEHSLELAEVDEQTLEEEKDAKIEIYNYAAGFGCVPRFEAKTVQPRTRRQRLRFKQLVRVAIEVEELSIDVAATGASLEVTEVAAVLAFKKRAEEMHMNKMTALSGDPFRALNTDTAKDYLNFCKDEGLQLSLEIVAERTGQGNQATLTLNGTPLGSVTMRRKKDAQAAAYLTGALEIAKQHPDLLVEFDRALEEGNGKVLKAVQPIALELDPGISQTMRRALAEAHSSGLPATQDVLLPETSEGEDDPARSRRPSGRARTVQDRQRLREDQRAYEADPALQELREKKAALPMSQYRSQLLEMINGNAYSIVVGATGSGKTTQVPQILFEDAIRKYEGPYCNIICTQPRRIAATSVARRVAQERNEPLRETVGYHVRFDARLPYNPYGISYCTTGILLEKLKHDPDGVLEAASHILIDEVHEREIGIDFTMIVLKKAIHARQLEGKHVPKVVLMSATLDTDLFANYFKQPDETGTLQPAPCLTVPGRTYPVQQRYLGSIMQELFDAHGPEARELIELEPQSRDFLKVETDFSSSMSGVTNRKPDSVIDWKRERNSLVDTEGEISAKDEKEEALVPTGLLATTIAHISATTSDDGAVLAFLPGLEEITKTRDALLRSNMFGMDFNDGTKFKICLLHSSLPREEQQEIFKASPPGCRKIILSTNIAETSVTVTDVKYVVDTGKLRESRYDQLRRITKLQCVWESKSNSKQRMGRAGRVQDGFYYALFSKERADTLRAIGLPELLRSDLQETCLSITSQKFNEPVASFLAQAIEPPPEEAVIAAIQSLVSIEAYTADEELTALGRVLSSMPVHPTLGKMIILGAIFKCLDPMIAIGAAVEVRPLFVVPLLNRQEAQKAHSTYAPETASDHLAHLAAFKELRQISCDQGIDAMRLRAKEQFLHIGAFRQIHQTGQQIVEILVDSGLIPEDGMCEGPAYGPASLNSNAENSDLIKCLVLAGSHPNLAVKLSEKQLTYRSPRETGVSMHPGSVNRDRKRKDDTMLHPTNTLFTFTNLSRSNDGTSLHLRSTTKVTPLMAALFGGQLRITENQLEMDGWMPFSVKGYQKEFDTKLVLEFRKALERVLHRAYASLADLGEEGCGKVRGFADDPIRERFVQRVVEVLGGGASDDRRVNGWRDGWGMH